MSGFVYVPSPNENMAWYVHSSSLPYWKNYLLPLNWIEHNKHSMSQAQQSSPNLFHNCPSSFQPHPHYFSRCCPGSHSFTDHYWQDYYSMFGQCFSCTCNANSFDHCDGCKVDDQSEDFKDSEANPTGCSNKSQAKKKASPKFKKSNLKKKKKKRSRKQSSNISNDDPGYEFEIRYVLNEKYLEMKEATEKHQKERDALKKAAEEEANLERLSSYMNKLSTYEDFKEKIEIKKYYYGKKANIIASLESNMNVECLQFCNEHDPSEWPTPIES